MSGNLRTLLALSRRRGLLLLCLVLGGCAALYVLAARPLSAAANPAAASGDWLPVRCGDFEVLCREEGDLRAVKVTSMTFLRWGKVSYLIPEGTQVQKGDKLISLDAKDAEEEVQRHQEDFAAAERDLAQREQNRDLELRRLSTALVSERERAALAALRETELLAKPLPLDKEEAAAMLEGAKARLANAQAVLAAYKPLAEKGFGSGSDLAARELAVARAQVELRRAEMKHRLAMDGALPDDRAKAKLDSEHAGLAVKIKEIDAADQSDSLGAKVRAAERLVSFHKRRLVAHKEELERSTLYAPHEGIAVYRVMDWRGNKKVEVGETVGPWLSPMELPNYEKMKVRTQVPESFIRRIRARSLAASSSSAQEGGAPATQTPGSKARVVVKTQPGRVYMAEVTWIDGWARDRNSKLSDADIKAQGLSGVRVFDVEVELEESDPRNLREGFRAAVEFPVETHPNLISVPISVVSNRDGVPHVQVMDGRTPTWRKIELGLQSLDRVVVTAGLAAGERIFVPRAPPPPRVAEKAPPEEEKDVASARNGRGPRRGGGEAGASEMGPPFPVRKSGEASAASDTSRGARSRVPDRGAGAERGADAAGGGGASPGASAPSGGRPGGGRSGSGRRGGPR